MTGIIIKRGNLNIETEIWTFLHERRMQSENTWENIVHVIEMIYLQANNSKNCQQRSEARGDEEELFPITIVR